LINNPRLPVSGFPSGGGRINNDMGVVWLQFEVTMSGVFLDCVRSAWKVACSAGIVKLFMEFQPDIFFGRESLQPEQTRRETSFFAVAL